MFGGGFPGFFGGHQGYEEDEMSQEKDVDTNEYYNILGVGKEATTEEIKKAFKKACIKGDYKHPDKGGDPEKFKQLNEAAAVLGDPEKKKLYDKYGKNGLKESGMQSGSPFDFFNEMFGSGGERGKKKGAQKAKAKLRELSVTLEEVFKGKMMKFDHTRKRTCAACNGAGGKDVKKCPTCKGRKIVEKMVMIAPGMYTHQQSVCNACNGEGELCDPKSRCKTCKGQKIVDNTKNIEVSLEPGVPDDHDYIMHGESDEAPGIMAGDLYVRTKIKKHAVFTRKGADLFIDKKITLLEALTGFNFDIKHLDGVKLTIATAPNEIITEGQTKVVKNKGMPFWKDSFGYGNLYIKFQVTFPKSGELNAEAIEKLKQTLPGPKVKAVDKTKDFEYLDEFSEADMNPSAEGGTKQTREEDADEGQQGGQRVQCQQQ